MEGAGDQPGGDQRGEKEPGVFRGRWERSLWLEFRVSEGRLLDEEFGKTVCV